MLKHAHQGRKGQAVIYCETQVQNNFRDKHKRVRSPWLIVIYIFGYDQCRMYMDWSNVQVASGADGCAAYSTGGRRQVDGVCRRIIVGIMVDADCQARSSCNIARWA